MNAVASILAVTGTALLSGSTIALRLDRVTTPDDDIDPLNYCDQQTPEAVDVDVISSSPTGAWPLADGASTESAPSSYSNGQRLTRDVAPPGTRLAGVKATRVAKATPPAPKLTAGDLRRIRRRIRRDTRPPRTARTTTLRLAGIAALVFTTYRILTPAVDAQHEIADTTGMHSDCVDQCTGQ